MKNFNRPSFATSGSPVMRRDMLRANATLDFPNITAGNSADLTVTVPGAQVTDDVAVFHTAAPATALAIRAWVSADDTVTVRATNGTAGAIDQASTIYRLIVFKAY